MEQGQGENGVRLWRKGRRWRRIIVPQTLSTPTQCLLALPSDNVLPHRCSVQSHAGCSVAFWTERNDEAWMLRGELTARSCSIVASDPSLWLPPHPPPKTKKNRIPASKASLISFPTGWVQLWDAFWANLASTWRPKSLPNRGRNPKKWMLKNSTFLASILEGFGPRFGRVFERFFGPKTYAKSEHLISVKN